ncbi:hypothetical protein M0802_016940 [Mischocyttarus mexicanus]|nr:hypothetical protein M0802_016940 [Mischocyttarus mexicanus]
MGRRTKVKTALDFNLSHKKPKSDRRSREAIPWSEIRRHINLAIGLADAKAYSVSGIIKIRTEIKTFLAFDLSFKLRSDPTDRKAIP